MAFIPPPTKNLTPKAEAEAEANTDREVVAFLEGRAISAAEKKAARLASFKAATDAITIEDILAMDQDPTFLIDFRLPVQTFTPPPMARPLQLLGMARCSLDTSLPPASFTHGGTTVTTGDKSIGNQAYLTSLFTTTTNPRSEIEGTVSISANTVSVFNAASEDILTFEEDEVSASKVEQLEAMSQTEEPQSSSPVTDAAHTYRRGERAEGERSEEQVAQAPTITIIASISEAESEDLIIFDDQEHSVTGAAALPDESTLECYQFDRFRHDDAHSVFEHGEGEGGVEVRALDVTQSITLQTSCASGAKESLLDPTTIDPDLTVSPLASRYQTNKSRFPTRS